MGGHLEFIDKSSKDLLIGDQALASHTRKEKHDRVATHMRRLDSQPPYVAAILDYMNSLKYNFY